MRFEIASRSTWATSAMIPTVRSLASGMSQARKRTPLSLRASLKAAFPESQSSLAMTSDAPVTLGWCRALASYDRPFRHEAVFRGTAQSMVGPLAEIYDATTASGKAALFGFAAVPAANRAALGEETLTRAEIQQFVWLFGPDAAAPYATLVKNWTQDPWTATADDTTPTGHPPSFSGEWVTGEWGAPHHGGKRGKPIRTRIPGWSRYGISACD